MRTVLRVLPSVMLLVAATLAHAQSSPDPNGGGGFETPVSPLGRPAAWLDTSRLHVTSEFMFGSSFGGPAQGLQVTRLQYQLGRPLAMSVSLGNAFGGFNSRDNSMFLEGLDLSYRPFQSFLVQVHYQDVRSPLQLTSRGDYPFWR